MSDYFGTGTSLAQGLKGSGYDETSALFYIACPSGKDSAVDPVKNDGVPKLSHCFAPTLTRGMKMKIKIIQPTPALTRSPTPAPTQSPTPAPSKDGTTPAPTQSPTLAPTPGPTTPAPSLAPTPGPTPAPTPGTPQPTPGPTPGPTHGPTHGPTPRPVTPRPTPRPTNRLKELAPVTPRPTPRPTAGQKFLIKVDHTVKTGISLDGVNAEKLSKDKVAISDISKVIGSWGISIELAIFTLPVRKTHLHFQLGEITRLLDYKRRRRLADGDEEDGALVQFTILVTSEIDAEVDYAEIEETIFSAVTAELQTSVEDKTLETALVAAAEASESDVLADVAVAEEATIAYISENATSTYELTAVPAPTQKCTKQLKKQCKGKKAKKSKKKCKPCKKKCTKKLKKKCTGKKKKSKKCTVCKGGGKKKQK